MLELKKKLSIIRINLFRLFTILVQQNFGLCRKNLKILIYFTKGHHL